MQELPEWNFHHQYLGIKQECNNGVWRREYGVMGAVGIAVLDKRYDFMPEDYDNDNRARLWAVVFLSNGWIDLALKELKIDYTLSNELKRIPLPNPEEEHEEYIKALSELSKIFKEIKI